MTTKNLKRTIEVEKILYQFFIAEGGVLRYPKVKGILQYLSEHKFGVDVRYALYNLIKWGIIVPIYDNQYILSEPIVVKGRNYLAGVNLGNRLGPSLSVVNTKFQNIGLHVFTNSNGLEKLAVTIQHFDGLKLLKQIPTVAKLVKVNCVEVSTPVFKDRMHLYDPGQDNWSSITPTKIDSISECLIKVYNYNEHYFDYIFKYAGSCYRFKMAEVEKVSLFKLYLKLCVPMQLYTIENNQFKLMSNVPFPVTIERIIATEHLLNVGNIATDRCYQIGEKFNKRLKKILSI
ncbi:hypothetical protein [Sphingobacterium sp.]|uniref:hypothetical protein n=1 Tax=Sphingobacterium sp. TaxID=341027 RepID=UPI002FDB9266